MPRKPYGALPEHPNNRIREFRNAKRLSLEDLAARLGTTYQTVHRWELKGDLSVKKLGIVAAELGVTAAELIPGSFVPTPDEAALLELYQHASKATRRSMMKAVRGLAEDDGDGDDATDADSAERPSRRRATS